jgi:hypothetical protein
MASEPTLAAFQRAAVDHIVDRLRDRQGSRRFLLADEVGLGKTVVARGVIDRMAKGRPQPLKVVYLCSNAEIAQQNRKKLVDSGGVTVGRVTELALRGRTSAKRGSAVTLFAFTPGTSLSTGTGTGAERELLLFLLDKVADVHASGPDWQEFFRCSMHADRWSASTTWTRLQEKFSGQVPKTVQDAFRLAMRTIGPKTAGPTLLEELGEAVEAFDAENKSSRTTRNRLVGRCRTALQRATLSQIEPDLVLLDEVQRFKDVIDRASDEKQLASILLKPGTPTLILSATPYRMLTLDHEVESAKHHEDFFRTLRFLYASDEATPRRVEANLSAFGDRLRHVALDGTRDETIIGLKRAIEADLRRVISRTERNWYFEESSGSLRDAPAERTGLPNYEELREFFDLHQGLRDDLHGVGLVTDFWKSVPSLLTFMDGSYALTKRLRGEGTRVPARLVSKANDPSLVDRNQRLAKVIDHALGPDERAPFLWTKPTFTYHEDTAYGENPPRKMLVFSGWRFVPKAVSIVLSDTAARRINHVDVVGRQPIRLTRKLSQHVFDVCVPSFALARLVNPRMLSAGGNAPALSADEVRRRTTDALRAVFASAGITVSVGGKAKAWQAVMRLEREQGHGETLKTAMRSWLPPAEATGPTDLHRNQLLRWLDASVELTLSPSELDRIARVALGSPAVCLLRSLLAAFDTAAVERAYTAIWQAGFTELRAYFNRSVVQQVVRQYRPGSRIRSRRRGTWSDGGYTSKVLTYSLDHHWQAMLDEHTYLLDGGSASGAVISALDHYRSVWSLGQGARQTNAVRPRNGKATLGKRQEAWPTHFALAFGEELEPGQQLDGDAAKPLRRSEVREAFNSPFWPFVLATTSVGQEGLDFHLHCRDVFHWNLPSNPVDLEQREGRVNRRNGLAVRQSIAQDWSLHDIKDELPYGRLPWQVLFERLAVDKSRQRYKQGLYPHWIYECRDSRDTVGIVRHVAYFSASRDAQRYERLKTGLALYRLVFGQVNQEHLLKDLTGRLEQLDEEGQQKARKFLRGYMLSLSPITRGQAMGFAREEAIQLVASNEALVHLVSDVRGIVESHSIALAPVRAELESLLDVVISGRCRPPDLLKIATAMVYLRNPFDEHFDTQAVGGFDDDIEVIRQTYNEYIAR